MGRAKIGEEFSNTISLTKEVDFHRTQCFISWLSSYSSQRSEEQFGLSLDILPIGILLDPPSFRYGKEEESFTPLHIVGPLLAPTEGVMDDYPFRFLGPMYPPLLFILSQPTSCESMLWGSPPKWRPKRELLATSSSMPSHIWHHMMWLEIDPLLPICWGELGHLTAPKVCPN